MCKISGLPHICLGLYTRIYRLVSFIQFVAWYSRIIRKIAGGGRAPVTDQPASTVLSLVVHVFPARERNVVLILAGYKKHDFRYL
jgi:hypothetical protein